jgi:hypothetical protein
MSEKGSMYPVLISLQPMIEGRDTINRKEWNAICAMSVTTSRRQASHFWEVLGTLGVFRPINGTTWRIDSDAFYNALAKSNPGNGTERHSEVTA